MKILNNDWSFYKMKQDGSNVNMVGQHNVNEEKGGDINFFYSP